MRHSPKNDRGFSLVELMVVVAIIGILAGFSYIGMEFVQKERVNGATRQLLADLQKVRVDSLTSSAASAAIQGHGIRFSTGSYRLFTFNDADSDFVYSGATEEADKDGNALPSSEGWIKLPSSLTLSWSLPNDSVALIYNRFGFPTRYKVDGASDPLSSAPLDIFITNPVRNMSKCIKVTENSIREGVASGSNCTEQ